MYLFFNLLSFCGIQIGSVKVGNFLIAKKKKSGGESLRA